MKGGPKLAKSGPKLAKSGLKSAKTTARAAKAETRPNRTADRMVRFGLCGASKEVLLGYFGGPFVLLAHSFK